MSMPRRFSSEEIMMLAQLLWKKEKSHQIGMAVIQAIRSAYSEKPLFFSGRSKGRIIGGAFYLFSFVYDVGRTYFQIQLAMRCTDVTIRDGVKDWLNVFPQHFLGVKDKLRNLQGFRPTPTPQELELVKKGELSTYYLYGEPQ